MGKKNKTRFALAAFFLFLALPLLHAQLSVSIGPVDAIHAQLFTNETAEFKAVIINLSGERVAGEKFSVQPSQELALVADPESVPEQSFAVPELLPNQATEIRFWVHATSSPAERAVLTVNYGKEVFTDLAATTIRIVPSPLLVSVHLKKQTLNAGEQSEESVNFENISSQPIRNLHAELLVPFNVDSSAKPFEKELLEPGQKEENVVFEFSPRAITSGTKDLVLRTAFSDSNGSHVLEQHTPVGISQAGDSLLWLLGIVFLAGLLYWFYARTQSKPAMVHKESAPAKEEKKK